MSTDANTGEVLEIYAEKPHWEGCRIGRLCMPLDCKNNKAVIDPMDDDALLHGRQIGGDHGNFLWNCGSAGWTANVAALLIAGPVETMTKMTKKTTKTKDSRSNLQCYSLWQGCSSIIEQCCTAMIMQVEEAMGEWSAMQLFMAIVIAMASKTATWTSSSFHTF